MDEAQMQGGVRRRLSDKIEDAFDQACRQGQAEVAACMLKGLDQCLLGQPTPRERRQASLALLRACAERLDLLRHAQANTSAGLAIEHFPARQDIRFMNCSHTTV